MNVRTLTLRTTLSALRTEIVYSLARLKAHPLAAPHAPEFEALRSACDTVLTTENALRDGLDEADTAIDMRDEATRAKLAELEMIMANAAKEAAAMKAKLTAMA